MENEPFECLDSIVKLHTIHVELQDSILDLRVDCTDISGTVVEFLGRRTLSLGLLPEVFDQEGELLVPNIVGHDMVPTLKRVDMLLIQPCRGVQVAFKVHEPVFDFKVKVGPE